MPRSQIEIIADRLLRETEDDGPDPECERQVEVVQADGTGGHRDVHKHADPGEEVGHVVHPVHHLVLSEDYRLFRAVFSTTDQTRYEKINEG